MTRFARTSVAMTALALPTLFTPMPLDAGCNCGRGGGAVMTPAPMMPAPVMRAPVMAAPPMMYAPVARPMAAPGCAGGYGQRVPPLVGGRGVPPGTLGRTYILCSRELPEDEHPRNAGLEIQISDAVDIDVEKMEGFYGEDGLWHFMTDDPWLPTRPAIVKVVINRGGMRDVRVVRLIPGRILTVQF